MNVHPPEGEDHVASPRQKVDEDAEVPELRLVTGRLPVTPPLPDAARLTALAVIVPVPLGTSDAPVPTTIAAVVLVLPVSAENAEDPDERVLQPNPVPEVQISALVAPEQDGKASPEGVVAVSAPSTVFAVWVARFAFGKLPVTPVLRGSPVVFVSTPEAGVPSTGVVKVGAVSVSPAMVVVVLPDATEVDPRVMGNPVAPPVQSPLPTVHSRDQEPPFSYALQLPDASVPMPALPATGVSSPPADAGSARPC